MPRLGVCILVALVLLPAGRLTAANAAADNGVRLLRAELPRGAEIERVPCESLARAVGRATLAHRADAPAILSAALTGRRPCACVARLFRVAVAAAPRQASKLLETASALYPDCSDALTAALNEVGNSSTASSDSDSTVRGADAPDGADLNDRDASGLGFGDGFGPGFPGSPGFIGSPASGGVALPVPGAETPVVNG